MLKKTRPDGTYLGNLPHFTRLVPYLMPTRTESTIFFEQDFDVTKTLEYLARVNAGCENGRKNVTLFQIFLCAGVRTVALRPKLNRFVSGFNYYQRNRILMNFVAKKRLTDEGAEINVTIPFAPDETISSVAAKVQQYVSRGKSDEGNDSDDLNALIAKLPRFMIRFIIGLVKFLDYHNMLPGWFIRSTPFYSTIFFTNVGSVGIDAPFHHNFDFGTCSLFIAVGKIRREPVPAPDGTIQPRDRVKVTFTYDDRIADGIYCGRAIDLFKEFVENPETLETTPELTEELRTELMLKV
jgi:hypothetical protein